MLRGAGRIGWVTGAFWATLSVDPAQAQKFLVDAGQSGSVPQDLFVWLLAALVIVASLTMSRYRVFGFPAVADAWYASHRQWLLAVALGGAALGLFYVA